MPRPNVYPHVISGAGNIGLGWNARSQFYTDDSKGKLKALLPKEGSCFQLNVINLVAKSPNTAAAEVFINYALGTEAQKAFTETMFYAPSNSSEHRREPGRAGTPGEPQKRGHHVVFGDDHAA